MKIHIYTENSTLSNSDMIIAKEGAVVTLPISELENIGNMKVCLIGKEENMLLKAAIILNNTFSDSDVDEASIVCKDKNVMNELKTIRFSNKDGSPIKLSFILDGDKAVPTRTTRKKAKTDIAAVKKDKEEIIESKPANLKTTRTTDKVISLLEKAKVAPEYISLCKESIDQARDAEIGVPMLFKMKVKAANISMADDLYSQLEKICKDIKKKVKE